MIKCKIKDCNCHNYISIKSTNKIIDHIIVPILIVLRNIRNKGETYEFPLR